MTTPNPVLLRLLHRSILSVSIVAVAILARPGYAHSDSSWHADARVLMRADAVVLADVLEAGIAEEQLDPGDRYFVPRPYVRARVRQWILGRQTGAELYAHFPGSLAPPLVDSLRAWGASGDPSVLIYLSASGQGWIVNTAERLPSTSADVQVRDIVRTLKAISVDSLASKAPIALVGTLLWPPPDNRAASSSQALYFFRSDSIIYGAVAETIAVATPWQGSIRTGQALLLLKPDLDGTYQVVAEGLGYFRVHAGHLHSDSRPLAVLAQGIAAAHKARPPGN